VNYVPSLLSLEGGVSENLSVTISIKFSDIFLDATDSNYEIAVIKFTLFCTVLILALLNKTVFTQARARLCIYILIQQSKRQVPVMCKLLPSN